MNLDKFFTLLMGQCWHEFFNGSKYVTGCIHCKHHYGDAGDNPDHLSNPLPVLEWMREHMPDELEAFLLQIYAISYGKVPWFTNTYFAQSDLSNLAQYLIENPEWGISECAHDCKTCWRSPETREACRKKGTTVHPALRYAREEGK
jgi:hypothetical protein